MDLGYNLPLLDTNVAEAKKMFDVNFWGAMNVSRETIRFFREVNKPQGGRLWNVSSTAGIFPFASMGYYSASKHGIVPAVVGKDHPMTDLLPISSRRRHRSSCHRTRPEVEHQGRYTRIPSETV